MHFQFKNAEFSFKGDLEVNVENTALALQQESHSATLNLVGRLGPAFAEIGKAFAEKVAGATQAKPEQPKSTTRRRARKG